MVEQRRAGAKDGDAEKSRTKRKRRDESEASRWKRKRVDEDEEIVETEAGKERRLMWELQKKEKVYWVSLWEWTEDLESQQQVDDEWKDKVKSTLMLLASKLERIEELLAVMRDCMRDTVAAAEAEERAEAEKDGERVIVDSFVFLLSLFFFLTCKKICFLEMSGKISGKVSGEISRKDGNQKLRKRTEIS
jgi:hypothetical protein